MNYKPVVAENQSNGSTGTKACKARIETGNQSNGSACTKACDDAGKARIETVPGKDYILLPVWLADPLFSQSSKDYPDAGFKPSEEEEKKDAEDPRNEDSKVPSIEELRVNQEKDASINKTNTINTVSLTINVAGIEDNVVDENSLWIPILTIRIHKYHPVEQIIGGLNSAPQTRRMTKKDPKKVIQALKDPSWIEAMQEELLRFNYNRIEAIRLFLAYASFKDFVVYQMDVKSAFLYGKIEEEVYVCQPLGFEDPNLPDKVYKVEKALYGLHQAPKAWIFRYLKGQPKLGLWYPKDSPFDLVAYTDSDYTGASLDRKSTTEGCQFLRCRLISWQCKKQTMTKIHIDNESTIFIVKNPVFHSKIKHIEIRHHFIRDSNEKKLIQMIKIHTDQNVVDLLTKSFDVSRFVYLIASIGMLNL
ncbi:putative reverse transcriptase, RNA-dependent DNA polymerase [Tanacetum coccineum]|uniref:Reverse transcriptase, RNA-dependent DNA polymerase n=1 Tax=Tanacetum coccineum TaxID=301880 RepID=A0ABQ5CFR2_9ASTR